MLKTLSKHTHIKIHVTAADIALGTEDELPMAHAIRRALKTTEPVHIGGMSIVVGDPEDGLCFSLCPAGQEFNLGFGEGPQRPGTFVLSSW